MVAAWNRLLAACLVWPTKAYAVNLVCAFSSGFWLTVECSIWLVSPCRDPRAENLPEYLHLRKSLRTNVALGATQMLSNAIRSHDFIRTFPSKGELSSLIRSPVCRRLRNWWQAWLVIFEDVDWVYRNQLYAPNFQNRVSISGGLPLCIVESKGSFRQWIRRQQDLTVIKVQK